MTATTRTDQRLEALREQLAPVRTALLEGAEAEAAEIVAEATDFAHTTEAEAEAEVRAEIDRAERRTLRTARARANVELSQARADAHREVLDAREAVRQRLLAATRRAALDLRGDPHYPGMVERLEELARSQLGPHAVIEHDPDGLGGIVAVAGSRRVDYTLPALADRALDSLADEVSRLWA